MKTSARGQGEAVAAVVAEEGMSMLASGAVMAVSWSRSTADVLRFISSNRERDDGCGDIAAASLAPLAFCLSMVGCFGSECMSKEGGEEEKVM